jgi:hypothetical protein
MSQASEVNDYKSFANGLSIGQSKVDELKKFSESGILIVFSWACPHCIHHRSLINRLQLLYDLEKKSKGTKRTPKPHWVIGLDEHEGNEVGQAQGNALAKIGITPDFLPAIYIINAKTKNFEQVPATILDEMADVAQSSELIALTPLIQQYEKVIFEKK